MEGNLHGIDIFTSSDITTLISMSLRVVCGGGVFRCPIGLSCFRTVLAELGGPTIGQLPYIGQGDDYLISRGIGRDSVNPMNSNQLYSPYGHIDTHWLTQNKVVHKATNSHLTFSTMIYVQIFCDKPPSPLGNLTYLCVCVCVGGGGGAMASLLTNLRLHLLHNTLSRVKAWPKLNPSVDCTGHLPGNVCLRES